MAQRQSVPDSSSRASAKVVVGGWIGISYLRAAPFAGQSASTAFAAAPLCRAHRGRPAQVSCQVLQRPRPMLRTGALRWQAHDAGCKERVACAAQLPCPSATGRERHKQRQNLLPPASLFLPARACTPANMLTLDCKPSLKDDQQASLQTAVSWHPVWHQPLLRCQAHQVHGCTT